MNNFSLRSYLRGSRRHDKRRSPAATRASLRALHVHPYEFSRRLPPFAGAARSAHGPTVRELAYSLTDVSSGSRQTTSVVDNIMEALGDPNIYTLGVCGKDGGNTMYILEKVTKRVERDSLFGETVTVSIGNNPNLTSIQQQIADQLGLRFQGQGKEHKRAFSSFLGYGSNNKKVVKENARQLSDWIRGKPKVLFIFRGLAEGLDLGKLGIPFDADHKRFKYIITSESPEVLSNQMNAQRIFKS